MRLEIENISKIKEASIQMNGLTVIVGENSTGKSTIGRILFSTIKALANTKANDSKTREYQINILFQSMRVRLLGIKSLDIDKEGEKVLFSMLDKNTFLKDLDQSENIDDFINKYVKFVDKLNISPRQKKLIIDDLSNIRKCKIDENIEARLSSEIRYLIESEFLNKVCSNKSISGKVRFVADDNQSKLSYEITKNNDVEKVFYSKGNDFFTDVTYVETPLYLHMQDALTIASVYRELEQGQYPVSLMIPLHIKDIVDKIDYFKYSRPLKNKDFEMSDIMSGNFHYNEETRNIVFADKEGEYFPINVASGIKSFGLLQILLDGGRIGPNRILIWDEPENHLHPQWQIEFAKLFVLLAKSGIPILISTHSPYFLQAIRFYSATYSMDDYVNMYLADIKSDGQAVIEDVTNDLNKVFLKLATPLNDIMNVDMQRKKTRKSDVE